MKTVIGKRNTKATPKNAKYTGYNNTRREGGQTAKK